MKRLGTMVKRLRKEAHLNQTVLAYGISSTSDISRIENGEKEPDSFLMCALVQRLGKSLDEFEFIAAGNEYRMSLLRAKIQAAMLKKETDAAGQYLEQYESYQESRKNLHKQYVLMIRAAIRYIKYGVHTDCIEMLREAMALSIFGISDSITDSIELSCGLCLQEMHLLLFYSLLLLEKEKAAETVPLLEQLVTYIDKRYTSEELKINSLPGGCYLLAKAYLMQNEKERAYEACEKGVEYVRRNGSTAFLMELLLLQQECKYSSVTAQYLEAFGMFRCYAGYQEPEETVIKLLFHGSMRSVIFSGEMVKEAREAHGWSQEQLSKDICARETVAKIEKGRTPTVKMLYGLLDRLGVERRKYFCYVAADDFGTYELQRNCIKSLFQGNKTETGKLLGRLEKVLDVTIQFNGPFLQAARIVYRILCGSISDKEAVRQLEKLLCSSMPEFNGEVQRVPYQEECFMLNQIAVCLLKMEREQEALILYESIRKQYRECGPKSARQLETLLYLYCNYVEALGKCGFWEKAVQYGKEAVQLALQGQRGYMAVQLMKKTEEALEVCCAEEEEWEKNRWPEYINRLMDFFVVEN